MAATGNKLVTADGLAQSLGEVAGRGAVCELTLSGDGSTNATFTYQGLDGTFSFEAPMDGSEHERVATVPVASVVKVAYPNEPGVRVSTSWVDLVSDRGTSTQSVDFYLVRNTSASVAVTRASIPVPGGP